VYPARALSLLLLASPRLAATQDGAYGDAPVFQRIEALRPIAASIAPVCSAAVGVGAQ